MPLKKYEKGAHQKKLKKKRKYFGNSGIDCNFADANGPKPQAAATEAKMVR